MACDGSPPRAATSTAGRLLQAAGELAGGEEALAARLGMHVLLLRRYMAGHRELPEHLLVKTVDLLLEEREGRSPIDGEALRDGGDHHDSDFHA
jgi:hypothetical protein